LPDPQRTALDTALLRAESAGAPPDPRAVSIASLGVLRGLAASGPLLIAIDDVQWIDAPSARVLSYAIRRLADEPIALMVSLRVGSGSRGDALGIDRAMPAAEVRRLPVGPLSEEALARLLREGTPGVDLARPVVLRLHEISEGNPFFALEIARAVARQGARPEPGEPLPVPEDLQQLLAARLGALPRSGRPALLAVAASALPTEELVAAATGRGDLAIADIARAENAGIIERSGERIRFSHPLLGSTVYAGASANERRTLHRRLAEIVVDPEERARHLALASPEPDPVVAGALDDAARHARARGAPDASAALAELARQLTPTDDHGAQRRRSLAAAEYHFDAGDAGRAFVLLEEAAASSAAGPARAEILYRLSSMSWMNLERGVRGPLERALPEAGDDPDLLAGIHLDLAWVDIYQGDLAASLDHSTRAVENAEQITDPATRGDALATFGMVEFLMGRPADQFMAESLRLQDIGMETGSWTEGSVYTTPRSILGLQLMWAGELDPARNEFRLELVEYERHAMYTVRQEVLCYLAELECRAGNWHLAASYAAEAMETVIESGQTATQSHVVLFNQALAAAHLGEVEAARRQAEEGVRLALVNDDPFNASWNEAVLGFLELSLSNHEQALVHLVPVVRFLESMGAAEPGIIPCYPDVIEAMVMLGRLDEAEALLDSLEEKGRAHDRPWALATAGRCRGLFAGARGDVVNARRALEQALVDHGRVPQPFELARTLLVRGETERRAKQKRAARSFLEQALSIFEELGAPLWSAKAAAALARVSVGTTAPSELTPTELRITQLVGEGRTNREVADALFVSVKTVEANITRIFHKLGVRSRAELIRTVITTAEPEGDRPRV
jgi:DNA-binding CsgD family transcriptional regulator